MTPDVDWDAAVRAHGRRVLVSVLALGVPLDRAEDVAQRAWMRLVEKHGRGELARVELPGLAIAQARFFALDDRAAQTRAARRDVDVVGSGDASSLRSSAASPEDVLADRRRLERALAALATTGPQARRVFRLCCDDPPPAHAEVAAACGISVQRVRQILCEVRATMRRALMEEEAS